jgi:hypothetical protein
MSPRRRPLLVAAVLAAGLLIAPHASADDYSDDAWRSHDVDNLSRSLQDQPTQPTDPEYLADFASTATESWAENQLDQIREAGNGRVYAGLGQLLSGGSVGDPQAYHEVATTEVNFLMRSGAKLEGHIFHPVGTATDHGPRPAIVLTTGSIQGTQHMYWWHARTLARNGYVVFTWDVQGQGESETTPHRPGETVPFDPADGTTQDGVPFQQDFNFDEGTIDALRFFFSRPGEEYVPATWTAEDLAAARAAHDAGSEPIDWVNPVHASFDRVNLGLVGQSKGAGTVSYVQQCSDAGDLWAIPEAEGGLAEFCTRSFPIKAVIGFDSLSASHRGDITPLVPGMNQQADGYFLNPQPRQDAPTAEEQASRVDSGAFAAWSEADLDVYALTIRGGTHSEWTEVPFILPTTTYGTALADYYALAFFDRYVHPDEDRQARALDLLLSGPIQTAEERAEGTALPWRANQMSVRYQGAFRLTLDRAIGVPSTAEPSSYVLDRRSNVVTARDLRVYAGLSPVGDWTGANADMPTVLPGDRGTTDG